jgi:hypothetical protein
MPVGYVKRQFHHLQIQFSAGAYRKTLVRPRGKRQQWPEWHHVLAYGNLQTYRIVDLLVLVRTRPVRGRNALAIRHRRQGTECCP